MTHRFFLTANQRPLGGWTVPLEGISPQPSWSQLIGMVKAKQGQAYVGDDRLAYLICERDPSFCHSYVMNQVPAGHGTPLVAPKTSVKAVGCGGCAARAAARRAQNNGGIVR